MSGLYHAEESGHACGGRPVYRFLNGRNKWLFSHQPGLWRRAALVGGAASEAAAQVEQQQADQQADQQAGGGQLGGAAASGGTQAAQVAARGETQPHRLAPSSLRFPVVMPGENPWLNELAGTQRADARGVRVGLLVVEWYTAVAASGELTPEGRAMLSQ